ncbi:Helix-turn-helix domain-containing protein [Cohnella sp. OV330]|uniref:helix-turn-helix domain-containing protein n=1 Tax=Cohnella sp. OV330 TaxID=1855288 RepID=UPI0008E98C61|nr:helix-turn-helix domain-containing protein [Cohnella sp. OV330]SFB03605.1 Helix-turn-helix domain-containing protein [Cohnella sp. OV330]
MNIVLVDDEKGIVAGLQKMIGRHIPECEVTDVAYNGIEGYELIHRLRPDIAITDIRMPLSDGLDMIKKLIEAGSTTKFILLSGYADFEYARQAMQLGVRFYINKPVEEEELRDCVRQVMASISAERDKLREMDALKQEARQRNQESELPPQKKDLIAEIKAYVAANFDQPISLADLSSRFYISPIYLSQIFKQKTGETYVNFLAKVRIGKAKELLERTDLKVYEICQRVGYSDTQYFARLFEKWTGLKPTEYRKRQPDV